jgi:hypothetical protein
MPAVDAAHQRVEFVDFGFQRLRLRGRLRQFGLARAQAFEEARLHCRGPADRIEHADLAPDLDDGRVGGEQTIE